MEQRDTSNAWSNPNPAPGQSPQPILQPTPAQRPRHPAFDGGIGATAQWTAT